MFFVNDFQGVPTEHMWFMWGLMAIYIIFPVLYIMLIIVIEKESMKLEF